LDKAVPKLGYIPAINRSVNTIWGVLTIEQKTVEKTLEVKSLRKLSLSGTPMLYDTDHNVL
jgi:hypothetical protein